jgi:hypothetical protein
MGGLQMNILRIKNKEYEISHKLKHARYKWSDMEFDVISVTIDLDRNIEIYIGCLVYRGE